MRNLSIGATFLILTVAFVSQLQAADPVFVLLKTSKGEITLKLDADKAPISVENFVKYVKDGSFNGTIFHRVMKTFMIQGGGFTKELVQKESRAEIKYEGTNGLPNAKYTVAMARRSGEPNSGSNQFFINTVDNSNNLSARNSPDGAGYAVFGIVVAGEQVVDAIAAVRTSSQTATVTGGKKASFQDVPVEAVLIEKAEIIDASKIPAARK